MDHTDNSLAARICSHTQLLIISKISRPDLMRICSRVAKSSDSCSTSQMAFHVSSARTKFLHPRKMSKKHNPRVIRQNPRLIGDGSLTVLRTSTLSLPLNPIDSRATLVTGCIHGAHSELRNSENLAVPPTGGCDFGGV